MMGILQLNETFFFFSSRRRHTRSLRDWSQTCALPISRARLLADHGFSVLLIDLQGHGETPGRAVTLGWREAGDARAALGWLRVAAPSRRIGVIGCSLGGAAVLLGPQPAEIGRAHV